jgi:hypothetical protein
MSSENDDALIVIKNGWAIETHPEERSAIQ